MAVRCSGKTGEQFSWQFGLAVRQRRPVDSTNLSCLARLRSSPSTVATPPTPSGQPSLLRLVSSASILPLLPPPLSLSLSCLSSRLAFVSRCLSRSLCYSPPSHATRNPAPAMNTNASIEKYSRACIISFRGFSVSWPSYGNYCRCFVPFRSCSSLLPLCVSSRFSRLMIPND